MRSMYYLQKKQRPYWAIFLKDFPEACDYFHLLPDDIQRIIYQYTIGRQLQ